MTRCFARPERSGARGLGRASRASLLLPFFFFVVSRLLKWRRYVWNQFGFCGILQLNKIRLFGHTNRWVHLVTIRYAEVLKKRNTVHERALATLHCVSKHYFTVFVFAKRYCTHTGLCTDALETILFVSIFTITYAKFCYMSITRFIFKYVQIKKRFLVTLILARFILR